MLLGKVIDFKYFMKRDVILVLMCLSDACVFHLFAWGSHNIGVKFIISYMCICMSHDLRIYALCLKIGIKNIILFYDMCTYTVVRA